MSKPETHARKGLIFYPLALILLFFLQIFALNTNDILGMYLKDFGLALGLSLLMGLGIILLVRLAFKRFGDPILQNLVAGLLIAFLLISGDAFHLVHESVRVLGVKITVKSAMHFLLLSAVIMGLISALWFRMATKTRDAFHQGLTVAVGCLLALGVINVATNLLLHGPTRRENPRPDEIEAVQSTDTARLPDVYYIILDGYPSIRALKTMYNMDNTPFTDALETRGFYIPEESTVNYNGTLLSLGSTLNMEYLDWLNKLPDDFYKKRDAMTAALQENKVFASFRKHGYRVFNFGSGTEITAGAKVDVRIECGHLNEFSYLVLRKTLAGLFVKNLNISRRERFLCTFQKVPEIARLPERKFVFVHIMSPHRPFLFDAEGKPVEDPSNLGNEMLEKIEAGGYDAYRDPWTREHLVGQIQYLNGEVLRMIDHILANNPTRPIIIVQSDHGTNYALQKTPGLEPTPLMLFELMHNLNSYYVPDDVREKLYPTITPVNTFRILSSVLFKQPLELLPDINYWSPSEFMQSRERFHFRDMSRELRETRGQYRSASDLPPVAATPGH